MLSEGLFDGVGQVGTGALTKIIGSSKGKGYPRTGHEGPEVE